MNYRILFVIIILFLTIGKLNGQQLYNCTILRSIMQKIKVEKENINAARLIHGKYDIVILSYAEKKYYIRKLSEYSNDDVLDSVLRLNNIDDILDAEDDTLFFLTGRIFIVDSLNFFSSKCDCRIDNKDIFIVKDIHEIPDEKNKNIVDLVSVDNYRNHSAVSLQLRSPNSKKVIFLYLSEKNVPSVKKVVVVRGME